MVHGIEVAVSGWAAWSFVDSICLVGFDEALELFDSVADSLSSLGVPGAARLFETANVSITWDDIDSVAYGRFD